MAAPAQTQEKPIVTLTASNPARWDAAGQVGWFGGNERETAEEWNDWYDSASFSGSVGYYFTPHVKLELEVTATTPGTVFVQEQIPFPGTPGPIFRYGEREFRRTAAATGILYQFFENSWVHPFVGAGVELAHERSQLALQEQPVCVRGPCLPIMLPREVSTSDSVHPFATGGFKFYVSERAFVRTDVMTTFFEGGVESVRWRGGFGFDF